MDLYVSWFSSDQPNMSTPSIRNCAENPKPGGMPRLWRDYWDIYPIPIWRFGGGGGGVYKWGSKALIMGYNHTCPTLNYP